MNKIFSIAAALLLCTSTAFAEDTNEVSNENLNLYYIASDGNLSAQSWKVADLKKITFENGNMNVITAEGTTTSLPTSNIQKFFFGTTETATDIDAVKQDTKATMTNEVYDLMGHRLDIDRAQLPKGLYIINGKKTLIK